MDLSTVLLMATYTQNGNLPQVWLFAAIYLPICWLSLISWVAADTFLRQKVVQPTMMRTIN